MDENEINLKNYILDLISCYDEEYAKEQGIDVLDDEDIDNIIFNILDNATIRLEIQQELEEYAGFKKG